MSAGNTASVSSGAARTVIGPHTGWQDTATAGWQYLDLSDAKNRYVRVKVRADDIWLCFVADSTVTPTITDTGDTRTEDQAEYFVDGEKESFVVSPQSPVLAFITAGTAGVVSVHVA